MKSQISAVLACLIALPVFASLQENSKDIPPSGELVEVHACELYTGGCTASAQYDSGGRSLFRIWRFSGGSERGISLAGLDLGALEVANENLAKPETHAQQTVLYLPPDASAAQRAALVSWAKRECPDLANSTVTQKVEKLHFDRDGGTIHVQVGDQIALLTRAMEHCDAGSCGESLWYSPKSNCNISRFTVLVDEQCSVNEPAVSLSRREHGIRSVFFAEFGGVSPDGNAFSMAMLN